jgi:putative ABC transport system ATP-binding protein
MKIIHVDNLAKQYGNGETSVMAVRGIKFEVQSAELIAIMGESGSGKSTLLSMMGALNTPTSGKYRVDEIDVYALGQEERADFRRNFLGFIFQSFHLVPYLTVRENVMLPLAPVKMKRKEKRVLAEEALGRVGLAGKTHRLPSQISGGEQERVAIARAIVNRPPILLADEPTGNLDTKTSDEIMRLLQGLNGDGMTIIMVTHSPRNAQFAHRIIQLKDGEVQSFADNGKGRLRGASNHESSAMDLPQNTVFL